MTASPTDAEILAEELDRRVQRSASRGFIRMAIEALRTEGMAGTLRIHIPRKTTEPIECEFVGVNPHPDAEHRR